MKKFLPDLGKNRKGQFISLFFTPIGLLLIIALLVFIPIFIGGTAVIIRFIQIINQPVVAGNVPIWAIFVSILFIAFIIRRLRG